MATNQSRQSKSSNKKLVPESQAAIDRMKYEIAAELGIPISYPTNETMTEFSDELGNPVQVKQEPYWGGISSRDAGAVGGTITARLIQQAEQTLLGGK